MKRDTTRIKRNAEVFTPHHLVNQMLDKLPPETWKPDKTYIDPACGNGNMLIHVLYRKIAVHDHDPFGALESIYGCDIMRDNIEECRQRLLLVLQLLGVEVDKHDRAVVEKNIKWLDPKEYPKGSLDYDFGFED